VDDNGCTAKRRARRLTDHFPVKSRGPLPISPETQAMQTPKPIHQRLWGLAAAAVLPAVTLLTGCQVEMAGQTLPSPYYLTDDVQYYAPGPEFKLAREAAAMQEQAEAIESEMQAQGN
jgi:hypothetical protein